LGSVPILCLQRRGPARLAAFEKQLPDAIDLFTRTVRAGHNIHSGLDTAAAETADPVRMEFRKMIRYGCRHRPRLASFIQLDPAHAGHTERAW
jgi:Flp pilus assembly protein TadB